MILKNILLCVALGTVAKVDSTPGNDGVASLGWAIYLPEENVRDPGTAIKHQWFDFGSAVCHTMQKKEEDHYEFVEYDSMEKWVTSSSTDSSVDGSYKVASFSMAASAEVITKADSTTSTSFHSIAMKYEVIDKQQTISDQCLSKWAHGPGALEESYIEGTNPKQFYSTVRDEKSGEHDEGINRACSNTGLVRECKCHWDWDGDGKLEPRTIWITASTGDEGETVDDCNCAGRRLRFGYAADCNCGSDA